MKLGIEKIKELCVGAINIEQTENGILFYKMTKKQINGFYSLSNTLGARSETTTGIRLDFTTDSKYVSFTSIGGKKFEYLIDGVYQGTVGENAEGNDEKVTIELTRPCRFTLCFASHTISVIDDLEIEDGANAERYKFKEKVLFIGDSITQGWNSGNDVFSYAYRTSLALDFDSVIQGVGGAYYSPCTFDYCGYIPDRVIVAYGTNDVRRDVTSAEILENARKYLSLVKNTYKGAKLYAISPVWVSGGEIEKTAGNIFENYENIGRVIESLGFFHIKGMNLIPHDKKYYFDDLHPNKDGFEQYATNLVKILRNN